MDIITTPIAYRVEDGDVVAFMPKLEASPGCITCYAHVGQHSEASVEYMESLGEATPEQYADLHAELEGRGYRRADGLKTLIDYYRDTYDKGDPWGSNISAMFTACDYLHFVRGADVPASLQYQPGAGYPSEDEYLLPALQAATYAEICAFLSQLELFDKLCRATGLDY